MHAPQNGSGEALSGSEQPHLHQYTTGTRDVVDKSAASDGSAVPPHAAARKKRAARLARARVARSRSSESILETLRRGLTLSETALSDLEFGRECARGDFGGGDSPVAPGPGGNVEVTPSPRGPDGAGTLEFRIVARFKSRAIFELLSHVAANSPDGRPRWFRRGELAQRLDVGKTAVSNRVRAAQRALAQAGLNPGLLQSGRHGIRLAATARIEAARQ